MASDTPLNHELKDHEARIREIEVTLAALCKLTLGEEGNVEAAFRRERLLAVFIERVNSMSQADVVVEGKVVDAPD